MGIKIRFTVSVLIVSFTVLQAQDDLNVITGKWLQYSDARNSMYHYFSGLACDRLRARETEVRKISTLAEWKSRQEYIRKALNECIGAFPAKSQLNAKTIRTINKEKYRIEHIIYESQPGFYVTSSLFIPSGKKKIEKLPAIIYCSGHSADGYRSDIYQYAILNLVNKGFIIFAFDPVGQGERLEYYDKTTGESALGGPTSEHSYPGAQAFLTGNSQAKYMIWDGIRAVDYLLTRQEVDPARIGITGRSGGGTQSALIAAFDDRIYAAAPENYITNYTRLLQTIGPQDAEQNLYNFIGKGLDHSDLLIVRAPKPALMITTSNDMFSIQGSIETENEVARIYESYGMTGNFSRSEDDAGHASTSNNRQAMYSFFQKNLSNPGNPSDEAVHLLTADELRVTTSGQVSESLHGSTVFSLNTKKAEEQQGSLNLLRADPVSFLPIAVQSARKLSGFEYPVDSNDPVFSGRLKRNGYSIEKYSVKGEGDYIIPFLLLRPASSTGKALLYLNPDGKNAVLQAGDDMESFINNGYTILAADMIGTGETSHSDLHGDAYFNGASHNLWYAAILTGKTITGVRAGDVIRLAGILEEMGFSDITGYAKSHSAPELVHAAVFSDKIDAMILSGTYSSFMSIVTHRFYNPFYINGCVPSSTGYYDLPDLEAAFAPRKLIIEGPVDCLGTKTYSESISNDMDIVRKAYEILNASAFLKISAGNIGTSEILDFLNAGSKPGFPVNNKEE